METIRNYLESMFKNLPQTEVVIKAKYELGQMMEDKYYELIKEGKSESEAIGTVIAEFGNLEELAADLGIDEVFQKTKTANVNRRKLTLDEVKNFLKFKKQAAYLTATGVAFCISCVTGPIITEPLNMEDTLGPALLFLFIAIGVILLILGKSKKEDWKFINSEACMIDSISVEYLKNAKREFTSTYSIMTSIGILLCVFCVIPEIIIDNCNSFFLSNLSGAFFFWSISIGVFFIIVAKKIQNGYLFLLNLNNVDPTNIYWDNEQNNVIPESKPQYKNPVQKTIIEVFWPSVTCIYLIWSFVTFDWYISWIIWPVAAVVFTILKNIFANNSDN